MATAPLANLSLLSRGVGEVQQDGHEKIEVKLEPEDYNNWLEDSRRIWNIPAVLPPIQSTLPPTFHHTAGADRLTESLPSHRSRPVPTARDVEYSKVYLPKTFTTRKGALLLFSEDFANKKLSGSTEQVVVKEKPAPLPELRTVDDLAKSILAYGATKSFSYSGEYEANSDDIYLGFVNTRSKKYYERQYKPGFSAKRYLSSWSKLWDYSLLTKITNKGYIKPLPFQKKSDYDVSGIPLPYRILRQWLFAPGTIDGYTFYRQSKYQQVPTREPTIVIVEETPRPVSVESEISTGSIKVSSLIANKDLNYGELDSTTKESILTELLVKSAITHAIKKQKEYQETVSKNLDDEEAKRKASAKLYEFDMMNAIQSALENSAMPTVTFSTIESQGVIPQEYPKKKPRQGFRGVKGIGLRVSPTSSSVDSSFSIRSLEDKRRVLPPIIREDGKTSGHPLIGDEFPTIPTAVHSHLNQLHKPLSIADADEEYTSWRKSVLSSRNNVAVVGEDSSKPSKSMSKVTMDIGLDADDDKKSVISTMSMLSLTSKRSRYSGSGIDAPYTKGITARQDPSGSLLKVDMTGEENDPTAAITSWRYNVQQVEPYADRVKIEEVVEPPESLVEPTPSPLPPDVESSASEMEPSLAEEPTAEVEGEEEIEAAVEEVPAPPTPPISVPSPEEHRTPTSLPPPTPVESPAEITEDQFMEVLTEQAREIAKAVLEQNPDAGNDLAFDAKTAAEMLMSNLPDGHTATGSSSRTQSKTGHTLDAELEDGSATDDAVDGGGFTVGQLVKEGLEDLVVKLDEYVQQDEPSTAAPSTVYSPSVPSMHSQTPSVRSSRHSSAQQGISSGVSSAHQGISSRISSAQQEMSLAQSAAESRAASIPSAHHLTPSIAPSPTTVASLNQASPSKSGVSSARTQLKSASTINRELESAKAAAAANSISAEAERVQSELSKKSSTTPSKKSAGKVQHESEFVVGKVADKAELQQLYAPIDSDSSPGKAKAKPGKSKSIVPKPAPKKEAPKKVEKPPVKKIVKKGGKKKAKASAASAAVESHTETETSAIQTPEPEEEPDMEFVIVRDEFSDEEEKSEAEVKPQLGSVKSLNYGSASPGPSVTGSSTLDEEFDYTSEEEEAIPGLSNRDAQAAKRAAAKEKRRKEVERRRREREEALRKEKEDAERKERIRIQMEEERARREEEIRLKKEMEREERERLEREEEAKLKAQRDAQERERRRQEEMAKYLEEKRQRALEEERRRKELQAEKDAEEAERLRLEQEMLQAMAEEERAEFLRRKAEEERLQKIAEEEARIKREAEAKRAWEALQLQEAERKKAEEILRQRLLFQRSLNVEANGMDHSQDISRAFVFSYYELLKWLGYEIPDWAQFGPTPATNYNVVDPDLTNQPINQPKH